MITIDFNRIFDALIPPLLLVAFGGGIVVVAHFAYKFW